MFLNHKMKTQVEKRRQNPGWEKRGGSDGNEELETVASLASQETGMDENKSNLKSSQEEASVGMGKLLVTVLGIE